VWEENQASERDGRWWKETSVGWHHEQEEKKYVCLCASILCAINVLRKHFVAIDVLIPEAVLYIH